MMIRVLVSGCGFLPTASAAIAIRRIAMTVPVTTSRPIRFASFAWACSRMILASRVPSSETHEARNTSAATSKPAIAPSAQLPSSSWPIGTPKASTAMNARNRGGAILLPMVFGFAMA